MHLFFVYVEMLIKYLYKYTLISYFIYKYLFPSLFFFFYTSVYSLCILESSKVLAILKRNDSFCFKNHTHSTQTSCKREFYIFFILNWVDLVWFFGLKQSVLMHRRKIQVRFFRYFDGLCAFSRLNLSRVYIFFIKKYLSDKKHMADCLK